MLPESTCPEVIEMCIEYVFMIKIILLVPSKIQNRETTSNPKQPTDSKNGKPSQSTDTTKVAIKRHGSGGSGSSPDQDDFVMVPTDLTKDAAEVRKHKRDSFA